MSTITKEQEQKIADWLAAHDLPCGLGTEDSACSIAAINLALNGQLTDDIPACMSPVIGRWIIRVQDALPSSQRNSVEWKRLLPLAAGTGRKHESTRAALIVDWLWTVVLPKLQGSANARGFGEAWATMCAQKDSASARATDAAVYAADADADAAAVYAAAVYAAVYAADAAVYAADAAVYAAAAAAAADAAVYAAAADAAAAYAVTAAAAAAAAAATYAADAAAFWRAVEPCALLAKLIIVTE